MPIQGVEASYANLMGHSALLLNKPGTPYIFEILRIRQHSKFKLTILIDTFYKIMFISKLLKGLILVFYLDSKIRFVVLFLQKSLLVYRSVS
jgi:hypothetical protein